MINKYSIFIFTFFLVFRLNINQAQPVSQTNAVEVARKFMISRSGCFNQDSNKFIVSDHILYKIGSFDLIHVINYKPGGFILISADERFYPVLAFSPEGNFDITNMPDNCRSWIDLYIQQMEMALRDDRPFFNDIPLLWEAISVTSGVPSVEGFVLPLTTSTWSQYSYYNLMCPVEPESNDGHVPTGCVSLAMAQLMYYYRFPLAGIGTMLYTPSYHGGAYGPQYVDFSASVYDWQMMADISHEPNMEVAELCYHTGVSLKTSYSPEASGADIFDVPDAMRTHFCYVADDFLYRSQVPDTEEWASMIIGQLDRREPVLYRSSNGWSGHVYICDGYLNSTHFHFNWGWGGTYNGYYYIDELIPGGIQLNNSQGAVFNIFPDTSIYQYPLPFSDTVIMTSSFGSIEDGSGPWNYQENLSRSWILVPEDTSITNILLEFTMLDTEEDADFIKIFDGDSPGAPLLASMSGNDFPVSVNSSGPALFVSFETNETDQYNGFHGCYYGYRIPFCSGEQVITVTEGKIDDGSRFLEYLNNTECEWIIAPYISLLDSIANLSLSFNRFDLAEGDTVYVFDGVDDTFPLLGKFTKNVHPGSLITGSNKALIRFITNDRDTAQGWEIEWNIIPPDYCLDSTYFYPPGGIISDGSGNMNYVENTDCHYFIDLQETPDITIKFLEFDLENNYDFLKLFDADKPYNHLYRFSGHNLPDDISFSVNRLLIYFHSDGRDNYSGWKFTYTCYNSGIEENGLRFSVSPNPVVDEIKIETGSQVSGRITYRIYRLDGLTAITGVISYDPDYISLHSLPAGVYILVLDNGEMNFAYKIVKCH